MLMICAQLPLWKHWWTPPSVNHGIKRTHSVCYSEKMQYFWDRMMTHKIIWCILAKNTATSLVANCPAATLLIVCAAGCCRSGVVDCFGGCIVHFWGTPYSWKRVQVAKLVNGSRVFLVLWTMAMKFMRAPLFVCRKNLSRKACPTEQTGSARRK